MLLRLTWMRLKLKPPGSGLRMNGLREPGGAWISRPKRWVQIKLFKIMAGE